VSKLPRASLEKFTTLGVLSEASVTPRHPGALLHPEDVPVWSRLPPF